MKSELGIKFDKWLESKEGKECIDLYIVFTSRYEQVIKRRVELAFLAGAQANEDVHEEICIKLMKEDREDIDPNAG